MRRVAELYRTYVQAHGLERTGLLAALRDLAVAGRAGPPTTVLYPGCFLHITPSFYFPHVVYVDRHELAVSFFADVAAVDAFVQQHRHYRRPAYLRFIAQDYTSPLPLPDESFDLLLALYAGGIARTCRRYLRVGGLLLSNNFQGDALEAAGAPDLEPVAVGFERRGTVEFRADALAPYLTLEHARAAGADWSAGTGHRDAGRAAARPAADYYLFRKVRAPVGLSERPS